MVESNSPSSVLAQARLVVLLACLIGLVPRLVLALVTGGTQDVRTWQGFAAGVRREGPVGVYGIDFPVLEGTLYNHPPLVGYFLQLLNALESWGLPLALTLRAASSLADLACAVVVLEILRRRRSLRTAVAGAVVVAASPVLVLVSGYHGNTDPMMMLLLWLGAHLLVDRRAGVLGGAAAMLAVSVKIVSVVALPVLVVWLVRCGDRRLLARAACGAVGTGVVVWGPALLGHWAGLRANVLGYVGGADRPWGLVACADAVGLAQVADWLAGPGRYAVLLLCAAGPAALVWRRPRAVMECGAVSTAAFLALSPAFGVQYLAWAVAATVVLSVRTATAYGLMAGVLLLGVYAHWNRGFDWSNVAAGQVFTDGEVIAALLVWVVLVAAVGRGLGRVHRGAVPATGGAAPNNAPPPPKPRA